MDRVPKMQKKNFNSQINSHILFESNIRHVIVICSMYNHKDKGAKYLALHKYNNSCQSEIICVSRYNIVRKNVYFLFNKCLSITLRIKISEFQKNLLFSVQYMTINYFVTVVFELQYIVK